jgi:Fe-S oxidoreductase
MATFDEQHSTRGRANALVAALTAPDPRAALGGEELHGALDLCLECKACKSECPLSVDMASLKSEFLAQYYDVHGVPRRARAIAGIRTLNRLGSKVAPLTNALLRSTLVRTVLERMGGFDRRRPMPTLASESLDRWFRRRGGAGAARSGDRGTIILFSDTFTNYSEPSIGRAVVELLRGAGYRVELEARLCCGRPQISKGLLDDAKERARALVASLGPRVAAGARVVGWEPSCVSAMIDDIPSLLPDEPMARLLAEHVALAEDVILEAVQSGALEFAPDSPIAGRRIVFHGHCHQKAVIGTAGSIGLLRAIPGTDVVELDAGCCGMAGSFGFEVEHYDLSLKIGGDRLFPAVAAEPESTLFAATGVSCRQQIAHGTQRTALHPIELARAACSGTFPMEASAATRGGSG